MHIPFAVFISLALALPTFTAPIIRDIEPQDLAVRSVDEKPTALFARDGSLEARKAAAVKTAPKPIVKPVVPKPAPVAAPAKAAPKPAAPPAKPPVAPAPVTAPKPAAPPAKPPVVPAAPPAKPPVAPAKPPVAPAASAAAPVAKPPKPSAPPAKAPTKVSSAAAEPSAKKPTVSSASPVPSASKAATCTINSLSGAARKRTSTTLPGRSLATTQFHATCKNFASSIKAQVEAGTFALQTDRIFPNEFTWSGGFYLTPDQTNAQLFGATFLAAKCASEGGTVVMEFTLDSSALKVNKVGTSASTVDMFRANQSQFGNALI
ncbi:hypothetical protein K438DRAFT_7287 [Mycena galopus ATCC 62051]|nr:hypothetical protein K438DRAFT_7287 [Mycena galopus ATCC 62051]